jgi:hypothetical protein
MRTIQVLLVHLPFFQSVTTTTTTTTITSTTGNTATTHFCQPCLYARLRLYLRQTLRKTSRVNILTDQAMIETTARLKCLAAGTQTAPRADALRVVGLPRTPPLLPGPCWAK